ncbi:DUF3095 domain-containing protein [Maritimibacter sp. 55A14]|uniref:DUF3095 domain-containing protein n=1 Tax=Maritimibacter sp. 55A14 TaxID=2174844 RepID=UPI0011B1E8C8|nr:DUF3095 domain-containing protein [Maritimibacter sp. 55A14]
MEDDMLTVSCDRDANIKLLRQLELAGKIEIYGVAIEGHEDNRKLSGTKSLCDSGSVWWALR